jgi:glycosyltransferase involved in cell wall biosynthesis
VSALAAARRDPAIDGDRICAFPLEAILARAVRRLPGCAETWRIAERRCDSRIASLLSRLDPPPAVVHGFEGGCIRTLTEARRRGVATVLDVPNAHEFADTWLREEGLKGASAAVSEQLVNERKLADVLLAPSEFVEACLVENGVPPSKVERLPYGVDVDAFTPSRPRDDGVFRVLSVGTPSLRKGTPYLLEAWRRLRLPGAELVMIGGVSHGSDLVRRSGESAVRWLGQLPHSQIRDWFSRSDVFVLPSLAEGSALVTFEALASALPVVATANTGSVVRDGIDGIVVAPRDASGIADALHLLYRDESSRRRLGANGRDLVLANYTWDHYALRLLRVYERLVGRESA